MKKKILPFILFVVVLALPYSVFAGELVLIKGKGLPVCEAHYKNLKDLNYLDHMVCERDKYYPAQNGITRPKWEHLGLRENKELLSRLENFFQRGDQFAKSEYRVDEKGFDELIERWLDTSRGYPRTRIICLAKVDINNDGKAENVVLYHQGMCLDSHVYARALVVIDKLKNQINEKETEPLLQNIYFSYKELSSRARERIYNLYDVILFNNHTYFDKYDVRDSTFKIYRQSGDKVEEVCKFKYKE